jgi:Na+/H+-dicarboxylate symporter
LAPSLNKFIVELAPASIVKAMADNAILQIVVFSVFMGVAISAVGARAAPLVRGVSALADVMLQITNYVMAFAPIAVFGAIAAVITAQGLSILVTYGAFVGEFYLSLAILWTLLLLAGSVVLGPRTLELVRYIREPVLLAFSTASSEASYPKTLAQLERFGVPNRIASFVLPLGYSFNLDGSMMYMTFATLFIAQAYGIEFSAAQLATLMLLLMVTSKGMAAVPRASLVVVAATLPFFNIPEAGLLLVLGIDQFLDMGRTATNVVGNAVATAVVAKWEGELEASAAPDQAISLARPEDIS